MAARPHLALAQRGDVELARRCAARDADAVRQLVTANNQRLYRTAWSILKDRSEAEDAVQAGYLRAFAAIDGYEGRSSLSTWLTRIVVNVSLERLRTVRRRHAHLEADGVVALDSYREHLMRGSEPAAPDAALAREQLRRLIEHAVAGLPDQFRAVFVLREIEGLSIDETATALGLLPATVKTRLLRARRKLQAALAPEVHGALLGAFPFAGADCQAMTARIMASLQLR
jgi:RNA polymerase sigma-70 factor (ECF subfamily)